MTAAIPAGSYGDGAERSMIPLAETSVGLVVPVPIGLVLPNTKWKPSGRYLVVANLLPLLPQSYTPVAFRFRAIGGATWTIDDVYVDPKHR